MNHICDLFSSIATSIEPLHLHFSPKLSNAPFPYSTEYLYFKNYITQSFCFGFCFLSFPNQQATFSETLMPSFSALHEPSSTLCFMEKLVDGILKLPIFVLSQRYGNLIVIAPLWQSHLSRQFRYQTSIITRSINTTLFSVLQNFEPTQVFSVLIASFFQDI